MSVKTVFFTDDNIHVLCDLSVFITNRCTSVVSILRNDIHRYFVLTANCAVTGRKQTKLFSCVFFHKKTNGIRSHFGKGETGSLELARRWKENEKG